MNVHPVLGTFVLLLFASLASGQSLGEVARREEARRKTITEPSKVYTNADLRGGRSSPFPAPPAPVEPPESPEPAEPPEAAPSIGPKVESPTAAANPAKTEADWRDRITQATTGVDRTRTYLDALQSRINALTTDFVNRDDPAQRAVIGSERNKALAELNRLKIELDRQLKAIDDIQEEARRTGVPPGWLR